MKTRFHIIALAAAAIAFASCEKTPAATDDSGSGNGGDTPEVPTPDVPDPVLKITSSESVSAPAAGGDFEITYEITDPADGGKVSAAADADWISEISTATAGKVTFSVSRNTAAEERTATVTVTYAYGSEKLSEEVSVEQAAAEASQEDYDYDVSIRYFMGAYYGLTASSQQYFLLLSDGDAATGADVTLYTISYYAPKDAQIEFTGDRKVYPYEGTFTFSETDFQANTISPKSTVKYPGGSSTALFKDGTLTVSKEGSNYIFDAKLVDENGKTHHFIYSGDGICQNPYGY